MKQDQKEVLKAWIDGKTIQHKELDGSWRDCNSFEYCEKVNFYKNDEYRIKPKISTIEISVFNGEYGVEINDFFKANLKLTFENGELRKAEVI